MSNPNQNNPSTNRLPDIYRQPGSMFHDTFEQTPFLLSAPIEDWMTEGIEPYHTLHTLMSAATAPSPQGPVDIMLYAQRREPLPRQVGSNLNFWRNFNIEAIVRNTGEYVFYTYRPKEYLNSPVPEEAAGRKYLDNEQRQNFARGVTYWENAAQTSSPLTLQDLSRLRQWIKDAEYNEELTQNMVQLHRTRWPNSYPAGHPPKEPGWKSAMKWIGKRILGE